MERIEPEMMRIAQTLGITVEPETHNNDQEAKTLTLIKTALELTKNSGYETPAKKFVWGLVELMKAEALPHHSILGMERRDKTTMDKAQLTCLVDEFEEQKLESNATKGDLSKLRNEMAIQHHTTFKRVVEINEKTSEIASHNQKMKTILGQVNELMEHLDQSLLKRSEADRLKNKALLRVITDLSEIRAQINAQVVDPPKKEKHTITDPEDMDLDPPDRIQTQVLGNEADPVVIQSQTQVPGNEADPIVIQSQTQPEREAKNGKPLKLNLKPRKQTGWKPASVSDEIDKERATAGTTKWKPEVVPAPAIDAEALGLNAQHNNVREKIHKRPPPPSGLKIPEKLPIQIPLQEIQRKFGQILGELDDMNPLDPSQSLNWDANGTHPDNTPRLPETTRRDRTGRREAEGTGKHTQDKLEQLEKEIQKERTPPSQSFNSYATFLQREEENKRK